VALEGKVAIVTGGTVGIGRAVTELLLDRGASVVVVARDAERGRRMVEELGDRPVALWAGDVAEAATGPAAVALAQERFGGIDVLVNNAAVDHDEPLLQVAPETAEWVFRTNFHGSLRMLQAAAAAMVERGAGGAIVGLSSRLASIGVPGMAVYGAAKGAIEALTRGAAIELAPHGIRVNAVAPGFTATPLYESWLQQQPDPAATAAAQDAAIPLGRVATPYDVAATVAFLAGDDAAHITGAIVPVDGGYTAK
jgi:NAD(P)-dependent dehydrogenase (short-subunit alcohol dehydrogenase family)